MGITPQKVREILKISQEPVSLETPIGDEDDSQLGDFIEDEDAVVAVRGRQRDLRKRGARRARSTRCPTASARSSSCASA